MSGCDSSCRRRGNLSAACILVMWVALLGATIASAHNALGMAEGLGIFAAVVGVLAVFFAPKPQLPREP
jgi:hypothetical protein